jgi:hypothetical protein
MRLLQSVVSVSVTVSPRGERRGGGWRQDVRRERDRDFLSDANKRAVGGLGLVFVRNLTVSLAYERVGV